MRRLAAVVVGVLGLMSSSPARTFLPTDISGCSWLRADAGVYTDAGTTLAVHDDLVQQWNDQSGNARHATQAASLNRYRFDSLDNMLARSIRFEQTANPYMTISGVSLSRRALSVFGIVEGTTFGGGDRHYVGQQSTGSTFGLYVPTGTGLGDSASGLRKLSVNDGASIQFASVYAPTSPSLFGIAAGAANAKLITNNTVDTISTLAAGTVTALNIVGTTATFTTFWGGVRDLVVCDTQLSDPNIANIQAWANTRGAIDPSTALNSLVYWGDSISAGYNVSLNRTWQRLTRATKPRTVEYVIAISGSKIAEFAAVQVAVINPYVAAGKRNVILLYRGTSDIVNGTTGAAAYALLVTTAQSLRAAGFQKIAVGTMLPRTTGETERQNFNALVRADTTNWDAVLDWGADATIGQSGQQANATYYHDLIHPTAAGALIMAPYATSGLRPLLIDRGLIVPGSSR